MEEVRRDIQLLSKLMEFTEYHQYHQILIQPEYQLVCVKCLIGSSFTFEHDNGKNAPWSTIPEKITTELV